MGILPGRTRPRRLPGHPEMPFPLRPRLARTAALAAGLAAVPAGCEVLRRSHADAPPPHAPQSTDQPAADGGPGVVPASATSAAPGKTATRRGHYVYYSDFPLDPADPLLAELDALPDHVFGELGLPPTTRVIQVYLFETRERYEHYLAVQYKGTLTPRPAYFIADPPPFGGPDELKVFTWMGDRLRADLRHELTHALLHSVLRDVPLWLDEGLAGFFELAPDQDGLNAGHLDLLRRGPFQPDLARLEGLKDVRQMERPEYREAWAWVHLMLRGGPAGRQVLRDYLQAFRAKKDAGPLLPRLAAVYPDPDQTLADHLAGLPVPRGRAAPPR